MSCSRCGAASLGGAAFCYKCGAPLTLRSAKAPSEVVVNGITYRAGSGEFAEFYSAFPGGPWVRIVDGQVSRVKGSRSTGRTIGGIVCVLVAVVAGLQGWSWFSGYMDLEAEGNPFAGGLVPLALGAFAITAGFGVWGLILLTSDGKR